MAKPLRTAERLRMIDERLDRFEVKVDDRFAQVDKRFDEVDKRFDEVDKRFDDQRSHFDTLAEESREHFRNLYDRTTAQAEKTESRFKQFEGAIDNRLTDIQAALQALLAARSARRARKRVN